MSQMRQQIICLVALVGTLAATAQTLTVAGKIDGRQTNAFSAGGSPVDFFRQLLALSPEEQIAALTNRPPEVRGRILAKLSEYEALDPNERDLRLRATELRWWLIPLLRASPTDRAARLATVPAQLQELVKARLNEWGILPPPFQDEILANDDALHYMTTVGTTNPPSPTVREQHITRQFNQFFELTAEEKAATLKTLSEAERAQMQATLESFEKLPPQQRLLCMRNYAKFAGMSDAERAEFLKNAESWSKMSPEERQTWRELVQTVPIWPPLPPGLEPRDPDPAAGPPVPTPNMATNSR